MQKLEDLKIRPGLQALKPSLYLQHLRNHVTIIMPFVLSHNSTQTLKQGRRRDKQLIIISVRCIRHIRELFSGIRYFGLLEGHFVYLAEGLKVLVYRILGLWDIPD